MSNEANCNKTILKIYDGPQSTTRTDRAIARKVVYQSRMDRVLDLEDQGYDHISIMEILERGDS